MFTQLICDPVQQVIENDIINKVKDLKARGINPKLAVIRAGDDSGQLYYENAILKHAEEYGIETQAISFNNSVSQAYMEMALQTVNADDIVHGIILLRPFPEQIDEEKLRKMLNPAKDVDAITDRSIADTFLGRKDAFYSCTAEACIEALKYFEIDLDGRNVAVIGRSNSVGKPLAVMLMNMNATVTVCHSHTSVDDQIKACRNADIVVLATGRASAYGSEYFHDGQIILDVGTSTGEDGKLHGDLNIEEITQNKVINDLSYTPVPGGIGKITTALLLRNIIKSALIKDKL